MSSVDTQLSSNTVSPMKPYAQANNGQELFTDINERIDILYKVVRQLERHEARLQSYQAEAERELLRLGMRWTVREIVIQPSSIKSCKTDEERLQYLSQRRVTLLENNNTRMNDILEMKDEIQKRAAERLIKESNLVSYRVQPISDDECDGCVKAIAAVAAAVVLAPVVAVAAPVAALVLAPIVVPVVAAGCVLAGAAAVGVGAVVATAAVGVGAALAATAVVANELGLGILLPAMVIASIL